MTSNRAGRFLLILLGVGLAGCSCSAPAGPTIRESGVTPTTQSAYCSAIARVKRTPQPTDVGSAEELRRSFADAASMAEGAERASLEYLEQQTLALRERFRSSGDVIVDEYLGTTRAGEAFIDVKMASVRCGNVVPSSGRPS